MPHSFADIRIVPGVALTPNEYQASRLAARGYTCREVAQKLNVSEQSVKQSLYRARAKLGLRGGGGAGRELAAVVVAYQVGGYDAATRMLASLAEE